jgi:cleavage and polyadenylation specificity factor subunit 1
MLRRCFYQLLQKYGYTQIDYTPLIKKDPSGRCLAMQITRDKLAIIPFRQEQTQMDQPHMDLEGGVKITNVLPSFILDLEALDVRIRHIRGLEFLHGYHEPTIALLIENLPTWIG